MSEHSNKPVFDLAMQHLHADQPDKAAEICRARLLSNPDDVHLLTLQGVALIDARKPAEALPPLQQAAELAPRFARARENLGQRKILVDHADYLKIDTIHIGITHIGDYRLEGLTETVGGVSQLQLDILPDLVISDQIELQMTIHPLGLQAKFIILQDVGIILNRQSRIATRPVGAAGPEPL